MNAEIIAIGSELLSGQIVDTTSSYIAGCLAENGIGDGGAGLRSYKA
jgi:molybdopterin-biosynthesis enzyme MoeA-like protein